MAFTIRIEDSSHPQAKVGRNLSVVDNQTLSRGRSTILASTWEVFEENEGPPTRSSGGHLKKKHKKKKKKTNVHVDVSDEDLHIEFAELLEEPRNQYCPSLHGWREWKPRGEWIDPEEIRQETVNILKESYKRLPTKPTGPPLP